jgi:hypothetical protein
MGMSTAEGESTQVEPRGRAQRAFTAAAHAFGFSDTRKFSIELIVFAGVLIAAGAWGVFLFSHFEFERLCRGFDLWFDSDPGRTVANITNRWSIFHERSVLHPLYSLLIAGPFGLLQAAFGMPTSTLTALYVAVQSALVSGAAYGALRGFGLPRLDALLGLLLLNSTAAAIYWIGFPEWVAFGAATAVLSVAWVAAPATLRNRATGVAQNFLSGSMAATNWAVGAAASLVSDWPKLRWGQAFSHTRDAIALMAALTVVQYFLFPTTGGFLNIWREAGIFLRVDEVERSLLDYTIEFFGQTLVALNPGIGAEGPRQVPGWGVLIMTSQLQRVPVSALTLAIFALWLALWVLGLRAAFKGALRAPVIVMVLGTTAFFYVLHAVLGGELFLFTLHFAPLFVFIALWALRGEWKVLSRGLCVALIALSFAHNYPAFRSAAMTHNAIDASWLVRTDHPASSLHVQQTDCR